MPKRLLARAILGFILYLILVPALLFVSAGTTRWAMAWVYVALFLIASLGSRWAVFKRNPDTLQERARVFANEGTHPWDRLLLAINGLLGLVMLIVAGLDHRFRWSGKLPSGVPWLAAIVVLGGYALSAWAMAVNPFFSSVVRIQEERGHRMVTTGPYRFVRHPGYAGALLSSLALPIMLEALWALLPALVMVGALVVRTALEDRLLKEALPGYRAYAEKTRYRLIPGLW